MWIPKDRSRIHLEAPKSLVYYFALIKKNTDHWKIKITKYSVTLFSDPPSSSCACNLCGLHHFPGAQSRPSRLLDLIRPHLSPGSHSWLCFFFFLMQPQLHHPGWILVSASAFHLVSTPYTLSTNKLTLLETCLLYPLQMLYKTVRYMLLKNIYYYLSVQFPGLTELTVVISAWYRSRLCSPNTAIIYPPLNTTKFLTNPKHTGAFPSQSSNNLFPSESLSYFPSGLNPVVLQSCIIRKTTYVQCHLQNCCVNKKQASNRVT